MAEAGVSEFLLRWGSAVVAAAGTIAKEIKCFSFLYNDWRLAILMC